ncbi:MAG: GNAT family N-acetyltransferase [Candidatus Marinimicrobia bacterium]|nr:GNAT family N-acetyltransferase [Candidatus Neomarinimicrobiota bacterium]
MTILIRKFTPKDTRDWDEFVLNSNNGTIFHTRKFLGYHPPDHFKDNSLIFEKKGNILALLPAAIIRSEKEKILISHPGASVGALVVSENISFAETLSLTKKLVEYAKDQKINKVQLTIPPIIYSHKPSHYLDFSFQKQGFTYKKREMSSILFLEDTIEQNLKKFKPTHRTAVRKGIKSGIEVNQSEDIQSFYKILENNLSIRHNVKPTHTLEELTKLIKMFPEEIQLTAAFYKNKMIGGVVNFCVNRQVMLAFYISHLPEFQEMRPLNTLFYYIFDKAISKGYTIYDFGIFTVGESPNMGLARFKENFGASGIFRDTLELNLT